MTEGKKKDDGPRIIRRVLRARYDFLGFAKDTNIDGRARGARDEEKARERAGGRASERERGIITTITLPPWDRFREEEKGEEEDAEKKTKKKTKKTRRRKKKKKKKRRAQKKTVEMVWRSRTAGRGSGKPSSVPIVAILVLYLWPGAMISEPFVSSTTKENFTRFERY